MVGAVTLLALVVAVFLAYTANAGLPFVPTRELKVDIADGSDVVVGNDVREGGFRIGLVSDLKPIELSNGQVGAELTLRLDQANGTVPRDSTVSIEPKSVLGLKYVALTKGTSRRVVPDGGTLPIGQTRVPVQFDDVFKTFDPKTRTAVQQGLQGFGDALAARGSAVNDTISALPELLKHLTVVAGYLSAPSTELTRFIGGLNGLMGAVSPVSGALADAFGQMATTFAAIARDPQALEQTIAQSPSTLDAATSSLAVQRPFLADLATLGGYLTPATAELGRALPQLNPAIEVGTGVLRRTPSLDTKLQQVMDALKSLATFPGTNVALNGLTATVSTLNPMVRYLGPYVTVCNDWNYWWTFLAEHISEETSIGFAQRVLFNQSNSAQQNNVSQQGATAPVNGGGSDLSPFGGNQYLHSQNYGAAVDTHGNADCETGQRGYPRQLNGLDPQHRLLATDAHTPGDQGPTFTGRPHVPAGETYSRNPTTGPQLPSVPGNP